MMRHTIKKSDGFTLIELSIVLVIIGLIIGGILVGRDLIGASETRAQITQIERYNTATNTFRNKYGGLPGDLPAIYANQFGFIARGAFQGEGDGDGILIGPFNAGTEASGEMVVFWVDLTSAKMIDGSFTTANETTSPASDITGSNIGLYFPSAKIGKGNYVFVMSGAYWNGSWQNTGVNYFILSGVNNIAASSNAGKVGTTLTLPVIQAYNIDKKMDDGLPASGSVITQVPNGGGPVWTNAAPGTAQSQTSSTCYDNGGNASATMQYSLGMTTGNGNNLNCGLSFKFQ